MPVDVVAERSQARARTPIRPYVQTLPGREILTPLGAYHLIETRYDLSFSHGPLRLLEAFERDPAIAALLARDEALAAADLRSLAFLDTETTGLVGGAGTFAFLVGVGSCEGEQFVLRQYFLRDPGEEEAMLTALVGDLASRAGWVTFNGRAFDLPLLETRLTLIRQRGALGARPHLDLLMPARRLYRGRLESCALGYLEQHVFNIIREQDDVPGYLIPQMYLDYLRSGDPSEMHRVIY
ncbi:MAG: ribonuclease H-like domain-containing protein, partial [Anaerolineales bacterium]